MHCSIFMEAIVFYILSIMTAAVPLIILSSVNNDFFIKQLLCLCRGPPFLWLMFTLLLFFLVSNFSNMHVPYLNDWFPATVSILQIFIC